MLVVDEDGHYIATNTRAEQLTGYSREELTTLRAGQDLAGDEPSKRVYENLERLRKMHGRKVIRRKDERLIGGVRTNMSSVTFFILLLRPTRVAAVRG